MCSSLMDNKNLVFMCCSLVWNMNDGGRRYTYYTRISSTFTEIFSYYFKVKETFTFSSLYSSVYILYSLLHYFLLTDCCIYQTMLRMVINFKDKQLSMQNQKETLIIMILFYRRLDPLAQCSRFEAGNNASDFPPGDQAVNFICSFVSTKLKCVQPVYGVNLITKRNDRA